VSLEQDWTHPFHVSSGFAGTDKTVTVKVLLWSFFWSLADMFHWLGHYKQIFFGLEKGKYFSKVLIFEI
jgi:hypothetical protein